MYPQSLKNNLYTSKLHIEEKGLELLLKSNLENKYILEIACGNGFYSKWVAENFLNSKIYGVDFDPNKIDLAKKNSINNDNLNYSSGDIAHLNQFSDNYFDLIFSRASLHHLTNNLEGISKELNRVLKPNSLCIFIREPLGHNPLWAGIRAMANSKKQLTDETNLYMKNLNKFGEVFDSYEFNSFDLFLYPFKILPSSYLTKYITLFVSKVDDLLFKKFPFLKKYGANMNIVFYKK